MRYVITQNSRHGHDFKAVDGRGYTWSSLEQAEIYTDLAWAEETAAAILGTVIPYTDALEIVKFETMMRKCGCRR